MQKGQHLEFACQTCKNPIRFSIFELEKGHGLIICSHCNTKYALGDDTLKRQLRKFEALCKQIRDSEEILGNTSVGIDIGEHRVQIPYKLLLTRLSSSLNLKIGNEPVSIQFRIEPIKEAPF
jgi:hypothetical protein